MIQHNSGGLLDGLQDNRNVRERGDLSPSIFGRELNHIPITNSQMGHHFFSSILTREVDLIDNLEIMAQVCQYVMFLSLKPTKATSDFILTT